jgi:type II secretory pathway pseudopilin PulG
MMVVALVAVLAAIAIPNFVSQTAKTKGDAEVNAMFAELRMGEERYRAENGTYLATSTSETTLYPPTASSNERDMLASLPAAWRALKYRGAEKARCSYAVFIGPGGGGSIGTKATSFGFTAPTVDWYYILARCDLDNSTAVDGYYFTDSNNPAVRKQNPGR